MKGPGIRIDNDPRRIWRCPACGAAQRLPLDFTSVRCGCSRDAVSLKLMELTRPDRRSLRTDVRAVIDRILAGEEFARATSLASSDAEFHPRDAGYGAGDSRPSRRPTHRDRTHEPPRDSRPLDQIDDRSTAEKPAPVESIPADSRPPDPPVSSDDDSFGAGLSADE